MPSALRIIIDAAARDCHARAFAGLVILSHTAARSGMDVAPLPPLALVNPAKRVGLRPITNDARMALIASQRGTRAVEREADGFPSIAPQLPLTDAYLRACSLYNVRPNSGVRGRLQHIALDAVTCIDASGCMVGDAGLLPLVEIARRCPRLSLLDLTSCHLQNAGIEYLADCLIARTESEHISSHASVLTVTLRDNPRMTIGAGLVLVESCRICGPQLRVEGLEGGKGGVPFNLVLEMRRHGAEKRIA
jgi:hypothetical protein